MTRPTIEVAPFWRNIYVRLTLLLSQRIEELPNTFGVSFIRVSLYFSSYAQAMRLLVLSLVCQHLDEVESELLTPGASKTLGATPAPARLVTIMKEEQGGWRKTVRVLKYLSTVRDWEMGRLG